MFVHTYKAVGYQRTTILITALADHSSILTPPTMNRKTCVLTPVLHHGHGGRRAYNNMTTVLALVRVAGGAAPPRMSIISNPDDTNTLAQKGLPAPTAHIEILISKAEHDF